MPESDDLDRDFARARTLMSQGSKALREALAQFRALKPKVTKARGRGKLNQVIWDCERALGAHRQYFSQSGQDAWLETHVFKGKRGGRFVEIGGYDGFTGSNCLYFEAFHGWSGVLVEASPALKARAAAFRRCPCLGIAIAAGDGKAQFLEVVEGLTQMGGLLSSYDPGRRAAVEADPRHKGKVITVPTRPLAAILDDHELSVVDYISLDVEGGELAVLEAFPFDRYEITAWTIENNSGTEDIPRLMKSRGYRLVEGLGADDVYLRAPG
jgi:FkbM family methyltransferase